MQCRMGRVAPQCHQGPLCVSTSAFLTMRYNFVVVLIAYGYKLAASPLVSHLQRKRKRKTKHRKYTSVDSALFNKLFWTAPPEVDNTALSRNIKLPWCLERS